MNKNALLSNLDSIMTAAEECKILNETAFDILGQQAAIELADDNTLDTTGLLATIEVLRRRTEQATLLMAITIRQLDEAIDWAADAYQNTKKAE